MHTYMYIIEKGTARDRPFFRGEPKERILRSGFRHTANPRTNLVDFRGFDSSIKIHYIINTILIYIYIYIHAYI